jgi:hypothetical protein
MLRRTFLRMLAAGLSILGLPPRVVLGQSTDRGIGGTGVVEEPENDRGIGGTGVIGTIRRFGSIVVNGLRISYRPDVKVRVDGKPAGVSALKVGQVVRVIAARRSGHYSTKAIEVTSEVVGYVESVSHDHLIVLGQTVSIAGLAQPGHWEAGEHVAVSGLRRPDGAIVASRIDRRAGGTARVAGPIIRLSNGLIKIGALTLIGVDPALIGRRAVLDGRLVAGGFLVTASQDELSLLRPYAERLSIETYVAGEGRKLALGSGFELTGRSRFRVPRGHVTRAVITTTFANNGLLRLESIRPEPVHQDDRRKPSGAGGQGGDAFGPGGGPDGGPGGIGGTGNGPGGGMGRDTMPDSAPQGGTGSGGGPNGGTTGEPGGFGNPGGSGMPGMEPQSPFGSPGMGTPEGGFGGPPGGGRR